MLKNCAELVANPDRRNIFYEKCFRNGQDIDSIENICRPIANDLMNMTINYPLTIIYMPLKWCGFVYRRFESIMGLYQYHLSNSSPVPKKQTIFPIPCTPNNQYEGRNTMPAEFREIKPQSGIRYSCIWNWSRHTFS